MSILLPFQQKLGAWADKTFPHSDNAAKIEHLKDELKELEETPSDGTEMADMFLILLHLAHSHGVDLLAEADKKLEICEKRKWGTPDERGVSHHIEAEESAAPTMPKDALEVKTSRVEFWAEESGNFWLSNFYPAPIQWNGKEWPTSEHLYQGLKLEKTVDAERVRKAKTPEAAKNIAHEVGYNLSIPQRAHLMRIAIREKFSQHPNLAEKLLATQGVIVETSPHDHFWGEGYGEGLNLMGMLLTELRAEIRAKQQT
jgi:ribA/ribD-fused uncharacterized protein